MTCPLVKVIPTRIIRYDGTSSPDPIMRTPYRYDISFQSKFGYKLEVHLATVEEIIRQLMQNAKCGNPFLARELLAIILSAYARYRKIEKRN